MSKDALTLDYRWLGKHRPVADGATVNGPFTKKTTASSGTPTVQSNNGFMELTLEATSEVQNICLYWGDELGLDISKLLSFDVWCKLSASLPASVTASFGLGSARNDTVSSMTTYIAWQIAGNNNVKALSGDGTTTVSATASGDTLSTTVRRFSMDFASGVLTQSQPSQSLGGKANIKLSCEDSQGLLRPRFPNTLFSLNALANGLPGLQPFFQLQKTSSASVATLSIERILLRYRQG